MTSKVKYYFYPDGTVGSKVWRNEKGEAHRSDGPAIEYADGRRMWYKNGFLHREDGPAIENLFGTRKWYKNGRLHRDDGPAIVWEDNSYSYYLNNKQYSKKEYWEKIKRIKKGRDKR